MRSTPSPYSWRLHGGYMVVTWRLHGGYMAVTWRLHGGYMAVTWRLHGGYRRFEPLCDHVGGIISTPSSCDMQTSWRSHTSVVTRLDLPTI